MLITLEEFNEYMGNFDDSPLKVLYLETSQNVVENHLGYLLEKQDYTRTFSGKGEHNLELKNKSVNSVSSISISGEPVDITDLIIDSDLVYLEYEFFPEGFKNVTVSFDAGFTTENLPPVIKATILRIAGILNNESDGKVGVQSVSDSKTGSRTFMEIRFGKYLKLINRYKCII